MDRVRFVTRVLVSLLLAAQAAMPAAAALAEAPPAPVMHQPHLAPEGDAGCEQVHDELHCLLCRVLSGHIVSGHAAPDPAPAPDFVLPGPSSATAVPQSSLPATRFARAPPTS